MSKTTNKPTIKSDYTTIKNPDIFTKPPRETFQNKNGQLSEKQMKQLFEEGFVILDEFFDVENELNPVRKDIEDLVEETAQKLYKAGKIKKLYKKYGLFQRLNMIEKEFPGSNIIMHKLQRLPQTICDLWSGEKILNLVEQVLGTSDIVGHPVWNLRTKTPKNEATTVPWHQDVAYLDEDSYDVYQLTAWIPLLDTDEYNGCMQVMRGAHQPGRVATHQCCHGGTWYVMLEENEAIKTLGVDMEKDVVTCPVPYGGVLLFSNLLPHRSLNNVSSVTRWTLDLRWQKADHPVGFYGIKDGIRMRSSSDPDLKPDFQEWNKRNRHDAFLEVANKEAKEKGEKPFEEDEFDTSVPGPWMKKWEIVHVNKHTEAMEKEEKWQAPL